MKKPRLLDLKFNATKTRQIRLKSKTSKSIKITINIDAQSLEQLKKLATKTGTPYQRLLNQILKSGLENKSLSESRLDKLEKEVKALKQLVA